MCRIGADSLYLLTNNRIVSNIQYVKERDFKNFYACTLGDTKTFSKSYLLECRLCHTLKKCNF